MLYTGGDSQNVQFQNLAVPKDPSDPYLVEWVKSSNNPIMTPNEEEKELFRDPSTACEKKRRIFIASVSESTSKEIDIAKGWSGLQSFPRKIWLDKGGQQLVQCPVEEIEMLRTNQVELHNVILDAGSKLEISVTAAQSCHVGRARPTRNRSVSFNRSSVGLEYDKTNYAAFLDVDPVIEKLSQRTLIDHSIVESFGGGGKACITTRAYPTLAINNNAHIFVFNNGSQHVDISTLSAWSLNQVEIKLNH
ncbi:hypothetical protein FXO38_10029 [Capsicum annuum]|nr:hypothetical protein FXO38_10029 [Capsicum annuum]